MTTVKLDYTHNCHLALIVWRMMEPHTSTVQTKGITQHSEYN
ncbi:uncharacterized protein METZ01_LOCUS409801 [marine metagenome]|uniref:Uncharacterized protein n=1 Tax=marine metagenome TaxID=408172 RepID=A0A382WDP6_9ZZZZ